MKEPKKVIGQKLFKGGIFVTGNVVIMAGINRSKKGAVSNSLQLSCRRITLVK